ncbi:MAG: hypothetical protein KJ731_15655 [Alphaproteobacteria bacterium]|nr:hypothetical protein [Alphaproteobacteria bacterium]MBU1279812.1 hypothetical protein [Alphaproteobacteria bacterium]MBU1574716.1 hypothetical protein [Alphaproteobacteria bacterium]MBU1829886.1 hypothetical protein [Alphaproteobacteria bacterium]MBU2079328.1 hypothetical protein [Alphaproteobacteria bacterium]
MQYATDDELFHFVGRGMDNDEKFSLLLKVLRERTISHPPHEKGWGRFGYTSQFLDDVWQGDLISEKFLHSGDLLFPNITCFADIPFEALPLHMGKYSCFGLSFTKRYVAKYGGRPVMYFPIWGDDPHNQLFGRMALQRMNDTIMAIEVAKSEGQITNDVIRMIYMEFLAFIKPFNVELENEHGDQVYMEREWRKVGNLQFDVNDIKRVILPQKYHTTLQSDFPELGDRLFLPPSA